MRILVVAPQPYFQERGTPIAVRLLVQALGERGDQIDLLVYHEGEDVATPGVALHRIRPRPRVSGIRPGFSLKKVYCDLFLLPRIDQMLRAHRYDVIHATEEGVFLAHWLGRRHHVPFVYDMDSSMSHQILDRHGWLSPLRPLLAAAEARAMRAAVVVVPVCEALADVARQHGVTEPFVLKDVSLVDGPGVNSSISSPAGPVIDLRADGAGREQTLAMYIGNLEPYQGIDLLLESFRIVRERMSSAGLVVVGGNPVDVERYRARSVELGLADAVRFLGQQPVAQIGAYMRQADLLVSPRIQGQNTPMKVYTYLDSGVAVLATDLPTHTQVVDPAVAGLADPLPQPFAGEMEALLRDPARRRELAARARELIRREHSYDAFRDRVHTLYDRLERQLEG